MGGTTDIAAADLPAEASYRLLTGLVVPRPIAWVTTISAAGTVNLAPFSHFTFVSPKPPLLAISVGRKGDTYKDTARNILASEEFVVHIADRSLVEPLHDSAKEFAPEVSEVAELGLETAPSLHVAVPRLAAAPVAMECRLRHCIEFGETRSRLLVGEVLVFRLRDGLMADGKVDTRALDPIGRIAGPNYTTLGEIMTMRAIHQTSKS
ncbi:flavin reductase family protein [Bosea sp. NBC_00550]|uniref:flavin reductase family protein n=1 Tax=Bosea sp. NBC_00550 TaxID=2969621 RepID=UPI00222E132C|nr:flavin reductase family protein [Bosea sp. NBC_00550]UZF94709.1 flavin reductase family protein [Bosea sp. NBC_00550]